jgi:beta-glucanase (GH16 family)
MARRLVAVLLLLLAAQTASLATPESEASSVRRLIWADEFNGPAGARPNPSKWNFDVGGTGWGNNELQYYTSSPGNASLNGRGALAMTARSEPFTGPNGVSHAYTSARLQTWSTFRFKYGLIAARIQVPAGRGLLSGFWSLPAKAYDRSGPCPPCGEIDAMEVLGSLPHLLHGTLHGPWPWAPGGVSAKKRLSKSLSAGFHVYAARWSPNRICFLLDGKPYETLKPTDLRPGSKWPFRDPNFLLLSLAVGGRWPGAPKPSTHFPAQMHVDWVRVWR